MSRLTQLLDGLDAEIERAREEAKCVAAGNRSVRVPFHGDFAGAPLSVLKRLAWWTRELRGAACEPCDCANRFLDARTEAAALDAPLVHWWHRSSCARPDARAEIARLRAALTAIAGPDTTVERDWLAAIGELEPAVIGMVATARKALASPVRP